MTPSQLFPILEGLAGRLNNFDQNAIEWVRQVKSLLQSYNFRSLTDLQLTILADVDATAEIVGSGSFTHLIAALVIMKGAIATDAYGFVVFRGDEDDTTVAGNNVDNVDNIAIVSVQDVAVAGVNEYYGLITAKGSNQTGADSNAGFLTSDGIAVGADGGAAGAFATDACDVLLIYRD